MAEDKNKKQKEVELNDEQLDEVSGGKNLVNGNAIPH